MTLRSSLSRAAARAAACDALLCVTCTQPTDKPGDCTRDEFFDEALEICQRCPSLAAPRCLPGCGFTIAEDARGCVTTACAEGCDLCPPWASFSDVSLTCEDCPDGQRFDPSAGRCVDCPPGQRFDRATLQCVAGPPLPDMEVEMSIDMEVEMSSDMEVDMSLDMDPAADMSADLDMSADMAD